LRYRPASLLSVHAKLGKRILSSASGALQTSRSTIRGLAVIILIQQSNATNEACGDAELQHAFAILHTAQIRVLGGGRFSDGAGYVVLSHETDAQAAFQALSRAGLIASQLRPTPTPRSSKGSS
jgi:hypothetical protein